MKNDEASLRKRVLVQDESVDLCLLMKTYFLRKNFEVFITSTFGQALVLAKENQPDYVFLSDTDGHSINEAKRMIREVAPGADVRITADFRPGEFLA